MNSNQVTTGDMSAQNADIIFNHLQQLVDQLQKAAEFNPPDSNYNAYLHGQIYGIALTLRLLYPGPDNWGERAALLIRPVLTEHRCDCQEGPVNK